MMMPPRTVRELEARPVLRAMQAGEPCKEFMQRRGESSPSLCRSGTLKFVTQTLNGFRTGVRL